MPGKKRKPTVVDVFLTKVIFTIQIIYNMDVCVTEHNKNWAIVDKKTKVNKLVLDFGPPDAGLWEYRDALDEDMTKGSVFSLSHM